MTRAMTDDEDISELTEIGTSGALESLTRGEIDTQIATAKKYPRSVARFRKEAEALVSLDEETAGACIYSIPRGGKQIVGPSVRFAEIIFAIWGNARTGARPVSEDERYVTAQGVFHDLERNTAVAMEVRRPIVEKSGRRYKEDMIGVTVNAAGSIAMRNAILRGIPKALWLPVYNAAVSVAVGDGKTLEGRRGKVLEYFAKMGITAARVCAAVGKEGPDDIGPDELEALTGLRTALREGGTTIDEAFPPIVAEKATEANGAPGNGKDKAGQLAEKLKAEREGKSAPPEPASESAPPAAEELAAKKERKGKASAPPPEPSGEPSEADKIRIHIEELCDAYASRGLGNGFDVIEIAAGARKVAKIPEDKLAAVEAALTERLKAK